MCSGQSAGGLHELRPAIGTASIAKLEVAARPMHFPHSMRVHPGTSHIATKVGGSETKHLHLHMLQAKQAVMSLM